MWSDLVIFLSPVFDDITGMFQAHKPVCIQALVAQPPDEAFGECVLCRFPWPDEIEFHPFAIGLLIQGTTGKLRSVIDGDDFRQPPDFR